MRSLKTPERFEMSVASASSVMDMRGSSEGCASSGFMPLHSRPARPEFMVVASANLTSVRRRSKYLEAFLTTSSRTRYMILSPGTAFEVEAEFENRGACPESKLRIDRRHPVLENVTSRRMLPLSPKSSSGSSVSSMLMVFSGVGSGTGVPGCALSFWVDLPDGFGAHAAAGVFWLRVKLFV